MLGRTESRNAFQPATFGNLDDWTINSSPKEFKFWGDEDDDFKNTFPKDFNEGPHGLRGIGRYRSKSGVFSITQKLRFVETRDSGDFSTRLEGLEAPQGVTKSSRNRPQSHAQRTKREEPKLISWRPQSMKLMQIQKPGGHKEVRASFPDQFQYKVSKIHG